MSADAPDDTELAAYLAGDLDELAARRIEARLAEDPELGERLDRLHGVLLALRDPDAVEPPAGLSERLSERLDEEAGRRASSPAGGASGAGSQQGGASSREGWLAPLQRHLGTAAAAVVALVLLGGGFLLLSPPGANDEAAETAGMDAADEAAEESGDDAGGADTAETWAQEEADDGGESAADAPESGAADSDETEGDDSAPRTLSEVIPRSEARERADERWEAMPARDAACREEVEEAAPTPAVPVEVSDSPAGPGTRVYELVTARGEGDSLDRPARVTVEQATCDVVDVEVGD